MNKKVWLINVIMNSIVLCLTIVAIFLMFFVNNGALGTGNITSFKFFTVDSNVLMGIASAVSLFYLLFKKDKQYPKWLIVFKLVATTGVGLTFFVVFVFLAPLYGLPLLLQGSNLIMHLFEPLVAIVLMVLFEPKAKLKFIYNLFSIIPVGVYGTFYMINVAVNNDFGNFKGADWYGFGQWGLGVGFICLFMTVAAAFVFSIILYLVHQKTKIKRLFGEEKSQ